MFDTLGVCCLRPASPFLPSKQHASCCRERETQSGLNPGIGHFFHRFILAPPLEKEVIVAAKRHEEIPSSFRFDGRMIYFPPTTTYYLLGPPDRVQETGGGWKLQQLSQSVKWDRRGG